MALLLLLKLFPWECVLFAEALHSNGSTRYNIILNKHAGLSLHWQYILISATSWRLKKREMKLI
jgi:hypothetical protein